MSLILAASVAEFTQQVLLRYATLWEIAGNNGRVLRFTNHDRQLSFEGQLFDPDESLVASASARAEGLERHDRQVSGIVGASVVTLNDLQAGVFRGAQVAERLINSRYPWAGVILTRSWVIESTQFSESAWTASLESVSSILKAPLGSTYSRSCRFSLGDANCGVDLTKFESHQLAVASVSTPDNTRTRFSFADVLYSNAFADQFSVFGFITWLTGANAGFKTEIRDESRFGGTVTIELFENTPYDIDVLDRFTITTGCSRELSECRDKFDNLARHGGFPFIRGLDEANQVPDAVI